MTFLTPPTPLGFSKNYSFFEINIGPPLQNKLRTKMLPGLFSTSWARTAHHPGENSWIHACTHLADKHARVCTCILLYVCFVFGNYRSSIVMVKMIRGWKTMGTRETRVHVHLYTHVYHVSKHMWGKYELMNISRWYCISSREHVSTLAPEVGPKEHTLPMENN